MAMPQTFAMASLPTLYADAGVVRTFVRTCTAARPISTRLEPVLDLRGFNHWFLLTYTFPPCLPDPSRLVVPTRPVVVRAAPALPCVSRLRLPSASIGRCDGPLEGSFHPLTVKQRLVPNVRACLRGWEPPPGTTLHHTATITFVWMSSPQHRSWTTSMAQPPLP